MAVIAREIARTSPLRTFSAHSLTSQLMCVLVDRGSRKRAGAFLYYLFPRRYKATGKSHRSHDCRLNSAPISWYAVGVWCSARQGSFTWLKTSQNSAHRGLSSTQAQPTLV